MNHQLTAMVEALREIARVLREQSLNSPAAVQPNRDRREMMRESGRKAYRCGAPPLSPEASRAQGRTFAEQAEYLYGYAQASWSRDY